MLLSLFATFTLPAATYHLDAHAGNDATGTGAASKPFASWSRVRPLLQPGDRVILADGNYGSISESNESNPSRVFSDWVTVEAAPGAVPEVNRISFGQNASRFYGTDDTGSFDVYMKFSGLRIPNGVGGYGPRNLIVTNCIIERTPPWTGSTAAIERSAVYIRGGSDISILNCEITRTPTAMALTGHRFTIRGNHIHDITHDGIRCIGMVDSLIENNRIHGLDDGVYDRDADWSRHCDAIHIFIRGNPNGVRPNRNLVFRGNAIFDAESQGIQFNNYHGFPNEWNSNIVFENNIFGPTGANAFNNADPVDGLVFRHNTFIPFPEGRKYSNPNAASGRTLTLKNLTFRVSPETKDVAAYNNIFATSVGARSTALLWDYNLVQLDSSTSAHGRYTILNPGPHFANPDRFDGILIAGSPAINAGTRLSPIPLFDLDRLGLPRDLRPDMGAWEAPGNSPTAERPPTVVADRKTLFVDDFENALMREDEFLSGPSQQGLSWFHALSDAPRYKIEGTTTSHRNRLTGSQTAKPSWILSEQGHDWVDYDLEFLANNQYLTEGDGPLLLVQDHRNAYWLDIGKSAGRLVRFMDNAQGEPTSEVLATSTALRLPNSGAKSYRIMVDRVDDGIRFRVDGGLSGNINLDHTDSNVRALLVFQGGGIGFHKRTTYANHRVSYDNVRVTVRRLADGIVPGHPRGLRVISMSTVN